jgi:hypothetical protein
VDARHVLKLLALVQDDRHTVARVLAQLGADAIPRRLQRRQHGARGLGISRRTGLHDEVRRDGAMETGFRLTLAFDLVDHATRALMPRLPRQHGVQVGHRSRGIVPVIVEMREQDTRASVEFECERTLQRAERVVHPARVHGGYAEALQQRGRLGRRVQSLVEQQHGLRRPSLSQCLPAPRFVAARHVAAPGRARGHIVERLSEPIARAGKLAGGIKPDRLVGEVGRRLSQRLTGRIPERARSWVCRRRVCRIHHRRGVMAGSETGEDGGGEEERDEPGARRRQGFLISAEAR